MKFSKVLADSCYQPYQSYYIGYKDLKREVKELLKDAKISVKDATENNIHSPEGNFQILIDNELLKINTFARLQRQACLTELNSIMRRILRQKEKRAEGSIKSLVDIQGFNQDLAKVETDIIHLEQYVRLNFTGFLKITKKFDKLSGKSLTSYFMSFISQQEFLVNNNFPYLLYHLSYNYSLLRPSSWEEDTPSQVYNRIAFSVDKVDLCAVQADLTKKGIILHGKPTMQEFCMLGHGADRNQYQVPASAGSPNTKFLEETDYEDTRFVLSRSYFDTHNYSTFASPDEDAPDYMMVSAPPGQGPDSVYTAMKTHPFEGSLKYYLRNGGNLTEFLTSTEAMGTVPENQVYFARCVSFVSRFLFPGGIYLTVEEEHRLGAGDSIFPLLEDTHFPTPIMLLHVPSHLDIQEVTSQLRHSAMRRLSYFSYRQYLSWFFASESISRFYPDREMKPIWYPSFFLNQIYEDILEEEDFKDVMPETLHLHGTLTHPLLGGLKSENPRITKGIRSVALRVEPKTIFACERTFLDWTHVGLLLGSLGIALTTASREPGKDFLRPAGLLTSAMAAVFFLWSIFVFWRRMSALNRYEPCQFYSDRIGPTVLCLTLLAALTLTFKAQISETFRYSPGSSLEGIW